MRFSTSYFCHFSRHDEDVSTHDRDAANKAPVQSRDRGCAGKQTWHLHFIVFYWKGFPDKHRLTLFCHIRVTCYYYLHIAKIMKNLSNEY